MGDFIRFMAERQAENDRKWAQHPKMLLAMYTITGLVAFGCIISFIVWGIQVHNEKMELRRQAEVAAYEQAERARIEQEQLQARIDAENAEIARREEEVVLLAKLLSGIDGFVTNYSYSDGDIKTYAECVINRVINTKDGFPNTISEVILQKDQWVGFSEKNQVIDKYYRMAKQVIDDYYANKPRPCSSDYCWAELNRDGIWLKREFSSDHYVRMWRY